MGAFLRRELGRRGAWHEGEDFWVLMQFLCQGSAVAALLALLFLSLPLGGPASFGISHRLGSFSLGSPMALESFPN